MELGFIVRNETVDPKYAGRIVDARIAIDPVKFVSGLADEESAALLNALAEQTAGDNFVDAFEDKALKPLNDTFFLNERGTVIMDLFVARAAKLDRLPEDWEPDWVTDFRADAERLHAAICGGRIDEADRILRNMVPDANFLTVKAQTWLEGLHGTPQQESML